WSCPVCAKQITQKRRNELGKGIESWKTVHNGSVYLLTLTFSHSPDQSLKSNLEGLKRAMKRFYETTRVQAIFK
ncbi:protein rep, partial [Acinetobacter baumannii]